jgi:hypothetical protein
MSDNKMNPIDTQKIADVVNRMHLPSGLGTHENACSIAAINLALTGELTDRIPACMSEVIGRWIVVTQDAMPDSMRNSPEWKRLLPLAAGTGRAHEKERLGVLLAHMWAVSLPLIQPVADAQGFGDKWRTMTTEKTAATAWAAAEAARAAAEAEEVAAWTAKAAASAARAARAAEEAATWAAEAATWAAEEAAARAAAWAARAAEVWAAAWAARAAEVWAAAWETLNPRQLLADLIAVGWSE